MSATAQIMNGASNGRAAPTSLSPAGDPPERLPAEVEVAIVGTGFSGIGMGIRLLRSGREDFVLLERADELGGTWRDNTYPGCRCDVPSHLYSLSFAPNPDWSESFSTREEIHGYLRSIAEREGVMPRIRFGAEVTAADWDRDAQRWRIRTTRGELSARVLVSAVGALTEPRYPDIPGLGRFEGKVFHSARWDHDHELAGERVAVVGTGASAIQFVPRIQPEVGGLHLFQRTPAWVMPRLNRRITRAERALFRRFPALQRLARAAIYWSREALVYPLAKNRRALRRLERLARRHLERQIDDPGLRERLTPDYEIGCKRILISNDYYPALAAANVEMIDSGLREVRRRSVVAADGTEREVDTIIFGTGFQVTEMPGLDVFRGADGRSLAEVWDGSPAAHRGTTVAGFPNLFMLFGPNTGIGHTSATVMIEAQIGYVLEALRSMERAGAATIEPRAEAQAAFLAGVDRRMEGTVWTAGGCASWYLDRNGRNSTLWPDWTFRFARQMAGFELDEYVARPPQDPRAPDPGPARREPTLA